MMQLLRQLIGERRGCVRWQGGAVGVCLAILLAVGCEDVQFNWDPQPPKPRPVGPRVGRTASQSTTASSENSTGTPKAGPTATANRAETPPPLLSLYQLVLLSEPAPAEAPPGLKHVRLSKARARDVANVLAVLYIPSGPSGTDHRYTLVYPTTLEQTLAAEAAAMLDLASGAGEPAASASATRIWQWCAAEAFVVLNQPVLPEARRRRLAEQAMQIVPSAELSRTQRWIAAMIAGDVLANRVYDYIAADRAYEQAQSVAEPGSYEQMSTLFARSKAYVQDGKRDQARHICETIIGQFGALRGCEVFERTREALASWEKARR